MPIRPGCANCSVGTKTERGESIIIIDLTGNDEIILGIFIGILLSIFAICVYKCIFRLYIKNCRERMNKKKQLEIIDGDVKSVEEIKPIIVVNQ